MRCRRELIIRSARRALCQDSIGGADGSRHVPGGGGVLAGVRNSHVTCVNVFNPTGNLPLSYTQFFLHLYTILVSYVQASVC